MRALLSIATLFFISLPVLAQVTVGDNTIPEPGVLGLLGIGAAALVLAYRRKK